MKMRPETKEVLDKAVSEFVTAIETMNKPIEEHLATFRPEDLKTEELREEFLFLMAIVQSNGELAKRMREGLKILNDKEDEKEVKFGFIPDKKAA